MGHAQILVHYVGKRIDGATFEASPRYQGVRNFFTPDFMEKGWTRALQLMVEGDKWQFFVPAELSDRPLTFDHEAETEKAQQLMAPDKRIWVDATGNWMPYVGGDVW